MLPFSFAPGLLVQQVEAQELVEPRDGDRPTPPSTSKSKRPRQETPITACPTPTTSSDFCAELWTASASKTRTASASETRTPFKKQKKWEGEQNLRSVLTSTYDIAVATLPQNWARADWYTAMTVTPLANASCPVKPQAMHTATLSEDGLTLCIPRFLGLHLFGTASTDHRSEGDVFAQDDAVTLKFGTSLNCLQVKATSAALSSLRSPVGGAMLVLPCGFGKTVCGIWLAYTLNRKTMVVVHSEALADQWQERISTFLPGCRIGRIQKDVVNVSGCAIVVCMIQSLVKRSYSPETLSSFGLVIIDEAHHVAAPMFSQALGKLPARYVLGLSATPDRGDGLGNILEWFLGPIAFRTQRQQEQVDVRVLTFTRGAQKEVVNRKGDPLCSTMISNLATEGLRTVWIKELVNEQVVLRRNIMVLSDRLDHLVALHGMLVEDNPGVNIVQVVGGTKAEHRDAAFSSASVILSTYHYASEGIDIPRLDTLVLATPRGTIEQSVGRILRPFPGKKKPLVIDVKDPFSMFEGMSWKRHRYYKAQNYNIVFSSDVDVIE